MTHYVVRLFISYYKFILFFIFFFFSSRRRHTRFDCDWSSDVCSSDLPARELACSRGCRSPPLEPPASLRVSQPPCYRPGSFSGRSSWTAWGSDDPTTPLL